MAPVVEALAGEGHLVSVDTWTSSVARAAVESGAHLINDITGADPDTVAVAVETRTPIAVMHMRGRPQRHRDVDHGYDDVAAEVRQYLTQRAAEIVAARRARGLGRPRLSVRPRTGRQSAPAARSAAVGSSRTSRADLRLAQGLPRPTARTRRPALA